MLKLIDITKEYKLDEESTLALHDVAIEFRRSEFVSILGPSGCGKTTLLNIIGGLDRYTSGDIQVDGISTNEYDDVDWDTYRNRRIGFVFQSYNLIPHMNILKNVALCLTLAGVGSEERKERAMEALTKVGLANQAKKKPNQLSGGQMQRVAIARALVNNPDIILADEPTGALDTESGIQIMELLKEVANDRLVIMVTHNPSLAETYSTRIVYLNDGEIINDTMPIVEGEIEHSTTTDKVDGTSADTQSANSADAATPARKESNLRSRIRKVIEHDRSSMKLRTAISLSWNNLISKKGRTFLTSVAGSIGIIGIILVLSLSNGVSKFIRTLEENALSQYPIEVTETNVSLSSALDILMNSQSDRAEYPTTDEVYINTVLGNLIDNFANIMSTNNLEAFKKHVDANFNPDWGTVKYNFGTTLNIYCNYLGKDTYMKVNPFIDSMATVLGQLSGMEAMLDQINEFAQSMQLSSWDELSSNQKLLDQQYDVIGGRWPSKMNEVVIVVDEKNQINDYEQFILGIADPSEVVQLILGNKPGKTTFKIEDLLNIEYELISDADYYYLDETTGTYKSYERSRSDIEFIESNSHLTLKVAGIVRPKKGVGVTSINGIVGYRHELTEFLINESKNSSVGTAQIQAYEKTVLNYAKGREFYAGMTDTEILDLFATYSDERINNLIPSDIPAVADFSYSGNDGKPVTVSAGTRMSISTYRKALLSFGIADINKPQSIRFFCASFEAKDEIIKFIDNYFYDENGNGVRDNNESGIKYTDYLSLIMGYVGTLTQTVTGVLVGFAAISLIVSTIMIAIIIYTSVLERRKEIGVLRSLGARKKDISRVFLAESAIIGGYSGIIGILFSYLITLFGSAILRIYFEIDGLMTMTWWYCLMMLSISIVLSMFAGFIPSRIAAKKDPAIALRSE